MNVIVKDFPDEVWRNFKSVAVKKDLTIKDALSEAAREWTDKNDS